MKKWAPLLLTLLFALGVGVALSFNSLGSCDYVKDHLKTEKVCSLDSTITAVTVEKLSNPEFHSISQIFVFREQIKKNEATDSIFMSLPPSILRDVSQVLLNKHGTASKQSIVEEYTTNQEVYNNLKESPEAEELIEENIRADTSMVQELIANRVELIEKDTIIDGKKAKIKTVISYE